MISCTLGKDLSKLSMPVSLNEPLGALQVVCLCVCLHMCACMQLLWFLTCMPGNVFINTETL